MSCCEAEYIAAATMGCQAVWLAPLLSELRYVEVLVPVQSVDNKSTISLIKNPIHHGRSKTHWCKISSASGIMKIQTRLLCIYILTKLSGKEKFSELCSKIGFRTSSVGCIKALEENCQNKRLVLV
jgi:hypothetical protein